jgi:hypothetical protein
MKNRAETLEAIDSPIELKLKLPETSSFMGIPFKEHGFDLKLFIIGIVSVAGVVLAMGTLAYSGTILAKAIMGFF